MTVAILIAAIFYVLDLAAWNAGIRLTKLGNSTLFGNTGSFVFAIYGLWLVHRMPSLKQGGALALALAGAALLMSGSYELSPRNFTRRFADPGRRPALRRLSDLRRARREANSPPLPLLLLASLFGVPMLFAISAGARGADLAARLDAARHLRVVEPGARPGPAGLFDRHLAAPRRRAGDADPAGRRCRRLVRLWRRPVVDRCVGAAAIAIALVMVRLPERGLPVADDQPS